jgi:hypothetical protein
MGNERNKITPQPKRRYNKRCDAANNKGEIEARISLGINYLTLQL